jgi:hypothetical protein
MTSKQKTDLLFQLWNDSGLRKTELAKKCGYANSSNLCRKISGMAETKYEDIESVCNALGYEFKITINDK